MRLFLFKFRYVFRNITRTPFRTISLFLIITMLSFILLVTYSVKDATSTGYYMYEDVLCENIDIVVTYDAKSKSHIVDSSLIKSLDPYLDYYSPMFELSTLIEKDDNQVVLKLNAGKANDASSILEFEVQDIKYNEIVLTKTLASKLNAAVGDSVLVYAASNPLEYRVAQIIEDKSFLRKDTAFVLKDYYIKNYAKEALSLKINDLSSFDLATTIYINIKDNVNIEDMIKTLKGPDFYPNSVVRDPRNYNDLKSNVDLLCGVLYAVLFIFIIALTFVMISIVNLRIKTFKTEVGICETLGEKKTFVFKVLAIEIFILAFIGLFIAFLLCNFIYSKAFNILSGNYKFTYSFQPMQMILTVLSVIIICSITIISSLKKYQKLELVDLTKNKQYEKALNTKTLIILTSIFGVLTFLFYFVLRNYIPLKISSLIGIIITCIFGIFSVTLLVKIVCKIFIKEKTFELTFLRNLRKNKIKHNSLKILLISLFGIIICFCCIDTINHVIDTVKSSVNIDTIFVNPSGVTDEMVEEFKSYDSVISASKGWFESKISTSDGKNAFLLVFSCDVNDTFQLMNFKVDEKYHEALKDPNKNYIIVSNDFLLTSDYKIGDTLSFVLSNGIHSYEILGGADLATLEFGYTNDFYNAATESNTIIIHNDLSNQKALNEFRSEIVKKYSSNLSYVFNASNFLKDFLDRADSALYLAYAVVVIVLICFIISIINNTILNFNEVKGEFAVIEILGISPKKLNMMIVKEIIISYLAISIPLIIMSIFVLEYLPGLTLLLGYYVNIVKNPISIIIAVVVGMGCFLVSYLYYFIGARRLNVAQELKK